MATISNILTPPRNILSDTLSVATELVSKPIDLFENFVSEKKLEIPQYLTHNPLFELCKGGFNAVVPELTPKTLLMAAGAIAVCGAIPMLGVAGTVFGVITGGSELIHGLSQGDYQALGFGIVTLLTCGAMGVAGTVLSSLSEEKAIVTTVEMLASKGISKAAPTVLNRKLGAILDSDNISFHSLWVKRGNVLQPEDVAETVDFVNRAAITIKTINVRPSDSEIQTLIRQLEPIQHQTNSVPLSQARQSLLQAIEGATGKSTPLSNRAWLALAERYEADLEALNVAYTPGYNLPRKYPNHQLSPDFMDNERAKIEEFDDLLGKALTEYRDHERAAEKFVKENQNILFDVDQGDGFVGEAIYESNKKEARLLGVEPDELPDARERRPMPLDDLVYNIRMDLITRIKDCKGQVPD